MKKIYALLVVLVLALFGVVTSAGSANAVPSQPFAGVSQPFEVAGTALASGGNVRNIGEKPFWVDNNLIMSGFTSRQYGDPDANVLTIPADWRARIWQITSTGGWRWTGCFPASLTGSRPLPLGNTSYRIEIRYGVFC